MYDLLQTKTSYPLVHVTKVLIIVTLFDKSISLNMCCTGFFYIKFKKAHDCQSV